MMDNIYLSLPGILLNTSWFFSPFSQQPYGESALGIPILQVRKLRLGKVANTWVWT